MGFFKKNALRVSDKQRTRAAELTLRESIYPLCLVTILFFLWYVLKGRGGFRRFFDSMSLPYLRSKQVKSSSFLLTPQAPAS